MMGKPLKEIIKPAPCRFCHQKEDGGKNVLGAAVDLGVLGKIDVGVNAYIFSGGDVRKLYLWLWFDDGGQNGRTIEESGMWINFCPMCGRDLRIWEGEEENGNWQDQ